MRIDAAVAHSGQRFVIRQLQLDEPRPDEILVRIVGVGICHTDLVFASGASAYPLPAVLGHEGSGIVKRVGAAVSKVAPGDRVAITFRSCGECDRCSQGHPAYCRTMPALNYTGRRTDGSQTLLSEDGPVAGNFFGQSSFATFALTYERNVVKVPEALPLELAGPLGCGIQTGAGGVMRSLAAEPGSSILILGGGSVGLAAVMGAKIQRCGAIIVVEPQESRRKLALEFGATDTIDPNDEADLQQAVLARVPQGVDYAFDTTGIPAVLEAAARCLGSKGVFGIVGVCPPGTSVPGELLNVITFGHTIKGIIEGDSNPNEFIPELIEHHLAGRLPFDRLIKTFPLKDINAAIAAQHNGTCVKAVLLPNA